MKRINHIGGIAVAAIIVLSSCGGNHKNPGRTYMPDMAYSRTVESYAALDSNVYTSNPHDLGAKIYYTGMPVPGAIKRGDDYSFTLPHDTTSYTLSATIKNPYDTIAMSKHDMDEAERLYNINCGICHGAKGDASGPLGASGKVGGIANLTLQHYKEMKDGTMFYSITYGKNNMGSYASQLTKAQRWQVIKYVRKLQGGETAAPAATTTPAAATDSTNKK